MGRFVAVLVVALLGGNLITLLRAAPAAAGTGFAVGVTPGAAASSADMVNLFYRGTDGAVWLHNITKPGQAPQNLGGHLAGGPSAVWTAPGVLTPTGAFAVFGRGTDNRLWWTHQTVSGWSPWASLGGRLTSKPTAISSPAGSVGSIAVFASGTGGAVWYDFLTPHGWAGWQHLGGKLYAGTGPAAVYAGSAVYLTAVGADRALWLDVTSDGSRWSGWRSLGGRTTSNPGVTVVGRPGLAPQAAVAFVRGTNGAAWYRQFTEPGYPAPAGWHSLGGRLTSGIAAATVPGGQTYVFALGADNRAWLAHGVWPAVHGWSLASRADTWRSLPTAPIAGTSQLTSAWDGTEFLVYGRIGYRANADEFAAYNPATNTWRKLPVAPVPGPGSGYEGNENAVWTGSEMLIYGITRAAYNPATAQWRVLPASPLPPGIPEVMAWTGHQLVIWGIQGCCATPPAAVGAAYTPATNSWQKLPTSPLTARGGAMGTWTGKELIIVGGVTRNFVMFRDAAAYNPATRAWRKLAPMPERRVGATAVWDGTEVLIAGGLNDARATVGRTYADGIAYNPVTNTWRRLPAMDAGRTDYVATWTGRRILVWGGWTGSYYTRKLPSHGVAYDPRANRWSPLPASPMHGRFGAMVQWTGTEMIIWGGTWSNAKTTEYADGAAYTPGTS